MADQFVYTANGLTVYEGASAFYLVDNTTGQEAVLGDGVDMFSTEEGASLMVDTPEFYQALRDMIDNTPYITRVAYFSEEG